ncbi:hypothetical protein Syun_025723 [Stephania yunnanensis]|uniref:Uncharacterized protein n=1 Tax=Stephania yunnanensis TaxID=152371 RepID=A0AAP0EZB8_9MAGN
MRRREVGQHKVASKEIGKQGSSRTYERAAAASRGGALIMATVGGSTGEGLASLEHDGAMTDMAPAGGRTVDSSGGPAGTDAAGRRNNSLTTSLEKQLA